MKVEQPARVYQLENFGKDNGTQKIEFAGKEAGHHIVGVTNEEVLNVLIDRITTLHKKQPCDENRLAVDQLKNAKSYLRKRVERVQRHKRIKNVKEDGESESESASE
jgi:hypothetical protein